jgi:hypothetical protein
LIYAQKKTFCNKLNFCFDCFQKNIRKQSDIDIDNNNIHNLKKLNV